MPSVKRTNRIDSEASSFETPTVIMGLPEKLYQCQCCLTPQPDADSDCFECWRCGRRNKNAKLIDTSPH